MLIWVRWGLRTLSGCRMLAPCPVTAPVTAPRQQTRSYDRPPTVGEHVGNATTCYHLIPHAVSRRMRARDLPAAHMMRAPSLPARPSVIRRPSTIRLIRHPSRAIPPIRHALLPRSRLPHIVTYRSWSQAAVPYTLQPPPLLLLRLLLLPPITANARLA